MKILDYKYGLSNYMLGAFIEHGGAYFIFYAEAEDGRLLLLVRDRVHEPVGQHITCTITDDICGHGAHVFEGVIVENEAVGEHTEIDINMSILVVQYSRYTLQHEEGIETKVDPKYQFGEGSSWLRAEYEKRQAEGRLPWQAGGMRPNP